MKNSAVGYEWQDVRKNIFTPEEISASDLRVALIGELIKARQDKGITQKQLELLSGVKQPVNCQNGKTVPLFLKSVQS